MTIQYKEVFSSNVKALAYDDATSTLYVEWINSKTGRASAYAGVPIDVYENLLHAPSIGSMIHTDIKNTYPHKYSVIPQ